MIGYKIDLIFQNARSANQTTLASVPQQTLIFCADLKYNTIATQS
ncbi:hypothetical protein J807_1737 [Acinetobacter sp. 25977_4]|nr:hypothetical protein J633_1656 [Acinetobacter sp. 216872]EXS45173.1 hypothetical protein J660_2638 [Acinetobacter sp. 88816]EXT40649.1 hypothetical protein J811_0466 [Acinetobacter sp. 25977_8]EXT45060.1 hypothetical protein J810_1560 [Acinetobacter sp. 25977_7]EXT51016.1 hypothetical protein J807_1737 [Acinetobacter sp. 25977_4]EXT55280.1 hypothetical protein J806_2046 [Acinetobacter sp. 25977_3]EXT58944.1 hypothetical protein J805_1981 [Acinetobacter sp. 25977_2]KCY76378.1 hypothetical 